MGWGVLDGEEREGRKQRKKLTLHPPLLLLRPTKESALAMTKVARSEAEAARVSLRASRRDANAAAKGAASTDEVRRAEKRVQGLVDAAEKEVGVLLAAKEKDLKAV